MKWTKILDEELTKLINLGKKHEEIAIILNTTKKSVSNRCDRLKLKIVSTKDYVCLNCDNVFIGYIKEERKFCCNSCSNSYSNRSRKLSQETKNKISKKLTGKRKKVIKEITENELKTFSGYNENKNVILIKNEGEKKVVRKCRFCNLFNVEKKHKLICDECRINYYEFYRPSCDFDFDINEFSDKFNIDLIKQYGWYSPTNKRNNLNGVSKDHMYSVREGFINKVDPEIIKHPANCRLMLHIDNNRKNFNSIISLDELKKRIEIW